MLMTPEMADKMSDEYAREVMKNRFIDLFMDEPAIRKLMRDCMFDNSLKLSCKVFL